MKVLVRGFDCLILVLAVVHVGCSRIIRRGIFNLNTNVDQQSGLIDIDIFTMISKCAQDSLRPSIFALIFNSPDGQCYQNQNSHTQPELFNQVLSAMIDCDGSCNRLTVNAPYIGCVGERVLPMQMILNYRCTTNWSRPVVVQPVTTESSRVTRQDTTILPESNFTRYMLEAVVMEDTPGYLTAFTNEIRCSSKVYLKIDALRAFYNESVECHNVLFDLRNIETRLREPQTRILISQPFCDSISRAKPMELLIIYHCVNEEFTTTPTATTPADTTTDGTTHMVNASVTPETLNVTMSTEASVKTEKGIGPKPEHRAGESTGTPKHQVGETNRINLELILGIAIPLALLSIILPIITVILFKRRRRKTAKPLISQQSYQPNADDIYDNIGGDSNISLYQDPSKFLGVRSKYGTSNMSYQGSLRSGTYSIYTDPATNIPVVATGPPGTPSPIRDAVTSNDYGYSEDFYRGIPDGSDSCASSCHIYDAPITKAMQTDIQLRLKHENGQSEANVEKRISVPGYSHLEESQRHPYTAIDHSSNSIYHELENPVELYDSSIYCSVDDVRSSSQ